MSLRLVNCVDRSDLGKLTSTGGVLGPGGIWGRVQGAGSDHWGTRSLPSLPHHPRTARSRAKRAFSSSGYLTRTPGNEIKKN